MHSGILTPDKRLRVFVSSTLNELAPERAAASEAIATLRLTPVLFELGARPHPPQALYRSYLEQSDVFVGIYWESYGWIAPDADISGIEDEYRIASGMPRLVYVKEPAPEREEPLTAVLRSVETEAGLSYKTFETAAELTELISRDLALLVTEHFHLARMPDVSEGRPRGLPARATSFVGRGEELAAIETLLDGGARLLTLTGPGGIGKTRAAVEVAGRLRGRFADGVAFVPLDGVDSADLVAPAIVTAVGINDVGGDAVTRVLGFLQGRSMLLLLDNFEHVTAAAPVVSTLLEGAPGLTVLVTSRELLRLRPEHELRVPPLPETDGAALFADRAAAVHPSFDTRSPDAAAVTEICRCLDGVPLAIELAAPRLRLLTADQLLDQLRERIVLTGPRDAPTRQRTLQSAIAWSYDLLDADERRLFERLGIFPGSFTIEAVEAVAGTPSSLDLLASLLDKSLVYRLPEQGETRFAMLRMIREYALERLEEAGDAEEAGERFLEYYVQLAQQAEDGCRSSAQRQWKQTLDLEADNFRVALGWASERGRGADVSALVRGLWLWFWVHGNLREVQSWVARGRACGDTGGPLDRGWLLAIGGAFAVMEGEFEAGPRDLLEAHELLAEAGDRRGVATARLVLGYGAAPLKGETWAQSELAETLAMFEELDDLWGVGTTMHAMCRLRTVFDHYEGAGDLFERTLATVERVGDDLGVALALVNLAHAHLAAGELDATRAVIRRLLEHMASAGITYASDDLFDILARIELAEGEPLQAVELVAAAQNLREQHHTPLWPAALARHKVFLDELRASVGVEAFDEAYARGWALDLVEVRETARRLTSDAPIP